MNDKTVAVIQFFGIKFQRKGACVCVPFVCTNSYSNICVDGTRPQCNNKKDCKMHCKIGRGAQNEQYYSIMVLLHSLAWNLQGEKSAKNWTNIFSLSWIRQCYATEYRIERQWNIRGIGLCHTQTHTRSKTHSCQWNTQTKFTIVYMVNWM